MNDFTLDLEQPDSESRLSPVPSLPAQERRHRPHRWIARLTQIIFFT